MSFKPLQFNYTPPATVQASIPSSTPVLNAGTSSTNGVMQPLLAQAAATAFINLAATADYLADLIVNKYSNMGVTIDPNSDPETARALEACYGTIPPVVTTGMYSNLLDCQIALQSINTVVGTDSPITADPIMLSNVIQINRAVASSLLTDGGSDQLAVQSLTLLKGDSQIFQTISSSLTSTYQPGTDLSPSVSANLNTLINNESGLLGSLYTLQTQANAVNQDITNVVNNYVSQPIQDIVRITAAINLMSSLSLKSEAKKIFDGLGTVAVISLMSQVAPLYFAADQIVQRVLSPIKSMTGALGGILNTVNSSIQTLEKATNLTKVTANTLSQQGLKGFSNCNSCSQNILSTQSNSKLPPVPSFGKLSSGLITLGQHISSAMSAMNNQFTEMESSFIALQKRRNKDFGDVLQITCALQSAEALVSIGNQVINGNVSTAVNATSPVNTVNSVVASSTATAASPTTSTSSTASNTSTQTIPSNVRAVLVAGGVKTLGVASVNQ